MADDIKKEEKKEEKKVSKNVDKLVDEISKLTVLELSDLVKSLQDKLGVSAMPITAAAPAAAPAEQAEGGETASGGNQTVVMTNSGANKIAVIKALREINPNLSLMDAKNMTEQVPAEVIKDAKLEDVKSATDKLKAAGATVEAK